MYACTCEECGYQWDNDTTEDDCWYCGQEDCIAWEYTSPQKVQISRSIIQTEHITDWAMLDRLVAMTSNGQSVLGAPQAIQPPQTQPQQERLMSFGKLVETKTLVLGADIKQMSVESLVQSIKNLEKETRELAAIDTPSAKIDARKEEIAATLTIVAAELDSRA